MNSDTRNNGMFTYMHQTSGGNNDLSPGDHRPPNTPALPHPGRLYPNPSPTTCGYLNGQDEHTFHSQSSSGSSGPSSDDCRPPSTPAHPHPSRLYPNPSPAIGGYLNSPDEHAFQPIDPTLVHIQQLNHGLINQNTTLRRLEKHTANNDQILATILQRLDILEAAELARQDQAQATGNQQNSVKKDSTPTVSSALRAAVQRQAKALVGVSEFREITAKGTSHTKLILPPPHTVEGFIPRFSPDGHQLFNPDWTAKKSDTYNQKYINAIIQSVRKEAEDGTIDIPPEQRTIPIVRSAAEQYFATMAKRFACQTDPAQAAKQGLKQCSNKHLARKKAKQQNRLSAWPSFRMKHQLPDDLKQLIDVGYMSTEDEDNGQVPIDVWNARARTVCGLGQHAVEIQRIPWRTTKLSRFYYALDKQHFSSPADNKRSKVVNVRFHGFKENETKSMPQQHSRQALVPHYIVDENWLKRTKNEDLLLDDSPEPAAWSFLVIDDDEIDLRDLQALDEWEKETPEQINAEAE